VLPDVVENRDTVLLGPVGDGIQKSVIGPPAGGELDSDQAFADTSVDLAKGVVREIGIDDAVAKDEPRMLALECQHLAVRLGNVVGRREIHR
jgi:hypothetical protein